MKKNIFINFTKAIFSLFAISTAVMLFMVYKNINHPVAINFGICYLYLTFFILLFTPIMVIFNLRKLKWLQIKNKLIKFIGLFILLGSLNFIFDYFFKPGDINLVKNLTVAFGFSFGTSFLDVLFLNKKEKEIL